MANRKKFVIDTNVFMNDPNCIFNFQEHELIVPLTVLDELDNLKRNTNTNKAWAAKQALRTIDSVCEASPQCNDLRQPIIVNEYGGTFRVSTKDLDLTLSDNDLKIIEVTKQEQAILVTGDKGARTRARARGIDAQEYKSQAADRLDFTPITVKVEQKHLDYLKKHGFLDCNDSRIYANACVIVEGPAKEGIYYNSILCRYYDGKLEPLNVHPKVMGISPRNPEQAFALDMLLDPKIEIMTIMGKAGCGKTLLALCAGLKQVILDNRYKQVFVTRPIVSLGRDIGYLPGSVDEKVAPYMQPIFDNLEYIKSQKGNGIPVTTQAKSLQEQGVIHVEAMTFIRGRSIPKQFIIVDEAQNLTLHEAKTIITRCGENTKIILTGDPDQIDNHYLSKTTNGLTITTNKLLGEPTFGCIQLVRGERSKLATLAAERLN